MVGGALIILYLLIGLLIAIQVERRDPSCFGDSSASFILVWGLAAFFVVIIAPVWFVKWVAEGPKKHTIGTAWYRLKKALENS